MKASNYIELIYLVNSKYSHINELHTLKNLIEGQEMENSDIVDKMSTIISTTIQAHYKEELLKSPNHIDNYIDKEWLAKGQLVSIF